ncbi:hypothetical protein GCM10010145_58430 [Streptomyces ruber]|uniref:Uncharacterized protein n=2 Tax=Streptomyces TaxID=1883 RepID=A0A918EW67_9ACTN|nr:hypothetical protein [Streptomyces ruber]GGQ81013.1 hypothetical protein GCM10010145_58430 [Streptomyces ruber]
MAPPGRAGQGDRPGRPGTAGKQELARIREEAAGLRRAGGIPEAASVLSGGRSRPGACATSSC